MPTHRQVPTQCQPLRTRIVAVDHSKQLQPDSTEHRVTIVTVQIAVPSHGTLVAQCRVPDAYEPSDVPLDSWVRDYPRYVWFFGTQLPVELADSEEVAARLHSIGLHLRERFAAVRCRVVDDPPAYFTKGW